jgi:tRNA 2-selenouridine synthase
MRQFRQTDKLVYFRIVQFRASFLKFAAAVNVTQLDQFDELIDARSPSEFALDHIPGAINLPVLYDDERVRVGTQYKQESSFAAKKTGAALIARNIANHIENKLGNRVKHWRPLVYCWRGGNRSASLAHVLRQIGWQSQTLDGGYKAYRRHIVSELEQLPVTLNFRIVCGPTGSGKSRVLQHLALLGGQVLDLEELAAHRGSVLGNIPDCAQPTQKFFESSIWQQLRGFRADRPVFVEAESKKIGNLRVPETLVARMWASPSLRVEIPMPARVDFLLCDYQHFLQNFDDLKAKLSCLNSLHGAKKIEEWLKLASASKWPSLVEKLLVEHYDPAYQRSTLSHYPNLAQSPAFRAEQINESSLELLANTIFQEFSATGSSDPHVTARDAITQPAIPSS